MTLNTPFCRKQSGKAYLKRPAFPCQVFIRFFMWLNPCFSFMALTLVQIRTAKLSKEKCQNRIFSKGLACSYSWKRPCRIIHCHQVLHWLIYDRIFSTTTPSSPSQHHASKALLLPYSTFMRHIFHCILQCCAISTPALSAAVVFSGAVPSAASIFQSYMTHASILVPLP